MNDVCRRRLYRRASSRHPAPSMKLFLSLYTLVLLISAPQVTGLYLNPVSMTDSNKAKGYGLGTAALVCCIPSLLASIMCMYWFCRMEKRFRHRLIMILMYGDLMRGTWLFVFAVISLARGTVRTSATFCQVSGFLVQYGTQTSDYGVFVIALHSGIQVFYPSTLVSSDGLYPHRRYVYTGAVVLPILMAGLAFVNESWAYVSQGAYCTLPIRPFWYRLALTWVPRYIIIIVIIGLAVSIYAHVGFKVRAYSNIDQSLQSHKTCDGSTTSPQDDDQNETKMEDITFELTALESRPQPQRRKSSIGHGIFTSQRQVSSAPAPSPIDTQKAHCVSFDSDTINHSLPGDTLNLNRGRPDVVRPVLIAIPLDCGITVPISALTRIPPSRTQDSYLSRPNNPKPTVASSPSSSRTPSPSSPTQIRLVKQRQRIHRQLRMMFIYPLVYTLMWLIPFVMHCMNYWNKWAAHPVEFLSVGSSICITLMGLADALIFSLREKPWRGIEGGDGSFWGSFACWRSQGGNEGGDAEAGEGEQRSGARGRTSASGDFARNAAEQARARLDLEREERLAAFTSKQVDKRKGKGTEEEEGGRGGEDKVHQESHEEHRDHLDHDDQDGLNVGDGRDGQVYDDNGLEDDTV